MSRQSYEITPEESAPRRGYISLLEKILLVIAFVVVFGWVIRWENEGFTLFAEPFPLLSFFSALVLAVLICLKYFDKLTLPQKVYRLILSVGTLLPLLGFMISQMNLVGRALTVGGSILLAYLSLTTYWRDRIPQIALDPLRQTDEKTGPEQAGDAPAGEAGESPTPPDTPTAPPATPPPPSEPPLA